MDPYESGPTWLDAQYRFHHQGSKIRGGFGHRWDRPDPGYAGFLWAHNIVSEIEQIRIQDINEAYEHMLRSDVRYRFVIEMASLKASLRACL